MRSVILLQSIFSTLFLHAQGFNVLDPATNSGASRGASVREVPEGFLVFGERNDMDTVYRVHLSKYGTTGTLLWEQAIVDVAPTVIGYADAVSPTMADGGWLASVTLQEAGDMTWKAYRFDQDADTLWTKALSSAWQIFPRASAQQSGSLFYTAFTQAHPSSPAVATVVKVDTSGNVIRTVAFPEMEFDMLTLVAGKDDDLFIAAGRAVTQNPYRSVVARLDTALNVLWSRNIIVGFPGLSSYRSRVAKVSCDPNGDILVAGTCQGQWTPSGPAPVEFYLAKLSQSDGSLVWIQRYAVPVVDLGALTDMEYLPDGDVIACGSAVPGPDGEYHGFLQRYSPEGQERWRRFFRFFDAPDALHEFRDVTPTADGGFVLTGNARPNEQASSATWLLRTDAYGCLVPGCQAVGINGIMVGIPERSLQCSPVPAVDRLSVILELPSTLILHGRLRLVATDLEGKLVHEIPLEGLHDQQFNIEVADWARGTYFLNVLDGGLALIVRKVVLE